MTERISSDLLNLIISGRQTQMDHYGGKHLPYASLSAQGIEQQMVKLIGSDAGKVISVLDASQGYASACLGAAHPVIQKALSSAVQTDGYVTDELASLARSQLLENLFGENGGWATRFPKDQYHVSGRNSGSEGMELALRIALESRFDYRRLRMKAGQEQRKRILAFEGAWHGWTHGLVPLINRRHFSIGLPNYQFDSTFGITVDFIPFAEVSILEKYFAEYGNELLATIVEPIQGDAGIITPPSGYLKLLAHLCKSYNALLIADEVLTFAKTGQFFAMNDGNEILSTDITVIGKSLGMGVMPVSLVIARRDLTVRTCGAVATCDLRPIACRVIDQGVEYLMQHKLLERSQVLGEILRALLNEKLIKCFPKVYRQCRGVGLINGVELTEAAAGYVFDLRCHLLAAGVYVEFMAGAGKRSHGLSYVFPTLRIAPALIVTEIEVREIVERIRQGTETFIYEKKL